MVPAAQAAVAIEQAVLAGALAAAKQLGDEHNEEIIKNELDHLITRVEDRARHERETDEAVDAAVAAVTAAHVAAEKALNARIKTLQHQIGGGNWQDAVTKARRAADSANQKAASAEADQAKLKELMALQQIGPRMRAKGGELLSHVGAGKAAIAAAGLEAELAAPTPPCAADVGLTERWVDGLAAYLEEQIFFAGKGDVARTKLIMEAVVRRPAMQRMLDRRDRRTARLHRAMEAMIESAAGVLGHLKTGGTRMHDDHVRFQAIVTALVPEAADQLDLIRAIAELLGIHHEQIEHALERRRVANEDGTIGAFSRATTVSRKQRKDYRGVGRCVCIDYWHKATRLDTNVGKKKRNREVNPITGEVFYREHWRHVQYDTDQQVSCLSAPLPTTSPLYCPRLRNWLSTLLPMPL
jgi:hypothetical protein